MLLVQLKSVDVTCGNATLRTSPSSGQAAIRFLLRHLKLLACHSRAAFGVFVRPERPLLLIAKHIGKDLNS